jgi:AraC-like DNA-binding protein
MPPPIYYREYPAGPLLAGAVECFWTSVVCTASRTLAVHRVLPDNGMDLLFDFTAATGGRSSVIGTMTRSLEVTTTGPVDLLGVRFRPGGLARLLVLNAAELTDTSADLAHFWGGWAEEIWHRLGEAAPANRIPMLREMLAARISRRGDLFVEHCIARIEATHGTVRIRDLERSTGLGGRQLERKFSHQVGISPKVFARIVRFRSVIAAAESADRPDWATLAAELGFADQPHLVREFKAFAGATPTDYFESPGDQSRDVGFLQDACTDSG